MILIMLIGLLAPEPTTQLAAMQRSWWDCRYLGVVIINPQLVTSLFSGGGDHYCIWRGMAD